ncbi:MAG: hypothetical protein ABSA58_13765, partial [Acetobacteraceae bacterium]
MSVNISPPVAGDSAMLTVPIDVLSPTPTVAVAGADIEGGPEGGVIVNVSPEVNPPEMALSAASVMPVPELFRSRPIVPLPAAPVTVTVYEAPLPLIEAMVPVTEPVSASVKADVETPVTASEKTTANCSVPPLFAALPTVSIEVTEGAVCSIV